MQLCRRRFTCDDAKRHKSIRVTDCGPAQHTEEECAKDTHV